LAAGKEVAQLAATLGRTFPYELLRAGDREKVGELTRQIG
jgi:hypothetical protein